MKLGGVIRGWGRGGEGGEEYTANLQVVADSRQPASGSDLNGSWDKLKDKAS